jgi:zinc transport system substrate-binding protein
LLILFVSCDSNKNKNVDQVQPAVTVSILPQKTFVEKIAGNDFDIQVLIPPGASPATYSILPSQMKNLVRSKVWFRIGYIGFELSWKEKIEQANPMMEVIDLSQGLDLIKSDHHHSERIPIAGIDPHIWLSPSLVKQISRKTADVLISLNPEKKEIYNKNYSEFVKEIDQVDEHIKSLLRNYQGKEFIMFHPSLTYFAREYGLVQHSLESEGKEPSPQHMAEIMEIAGREDINVIYIQREFDNENARVFAEEIDGEIIEVTPLSPDWSDNLITITNLIIENF